MRMPGPAIYVSAAAILLLGSILPGFTVDTTTSKPMGAVLREPLPPEDLRLSTNAPDIIRVEGPTFAYEVQKSSGQISAFRVFSGDRELIKASAPWDVDVDGYRFEPGATGHVAVLRASPSRIELQAEGVLRASSGEGFELNYSLLHTFFNDGVVVCSLKLLPSKDLVVKSNIATQLRARGEFSHWLHKRRDENGSDAARGALPQKGRVAWQNVPSSCLQVFSPTAGMALFTDSGAAHIGTKGQLETASIDVTDRTSSGTEVSLTQYIVRVEARSEPFVLKAGEAIQFRTGISLTPCRVPHRRMHDLRMFAWIGDTKYPYPTDEEIGEIARAGYTVVHMHRLGTPGEPRPPARELERVIKTVHQHGMLFLWTENADLMYDSAAGVQEIRPKASLRSGKDSITAAVTRPRWIRIAT